MSDLPTVIVLAAGAGSRFTGPGHKLVQPGGGDGSPVLAQTLRHAIESGLPVAVVTTAELAPLAGQQLAARDVIVVPGVGRARGAGVGDSIAAGVAARADAPGWLILPGDMPRVLPRTLRAVAQALQDHPVVYAQHQGRRGHPVGFSAELYSELVVLSGDEGARRLVARYPSEGVEVDDPGVLLGIDTVDDLSAWRAASGAESSGQPLVR
ncbi:MAG TPA: nucleotidyltransferase family protein [Burkholderiaceae bacterium]|nr:nucleotidyltransferase family protein [Burkholderiaceae bacterium]